MTGLFDVTHGLICLTSWLSLFIVGCSLCRTFYTVFSIACWIVLYTRFDRFRQCTYDFVQPHCYVRQLIVVKEFLTLFDDLFRSFKLMMLLSIENLDICVPL